MKQFFLILLIVAITANICLSQIKSESDDFSYALKLYEEKFYDLSAQQFIKFSSNYPASSKLDEAGFYAGMSLYNLKDYNNARIEFQSVAVNYPKSKRAPESWFMCGQSYANLDMIEEAAKSYETIKTLYIRSPKAPDGALKAGNIYLSLNNFEKADQLFSLIQDRYVESNSYFPSLLSHGKLYFKIGKISKAKEKFNKILQSDSDYDAKAQANYLLGTLSEQQGYSKDADKYFSIIRNKYNKSKDYINASIKLAKIKIQNSDYNESIQILNDAAKSNSNEELKNEISELLGDAYFLNNKFALAQKSYQNSIHNVNGYTNSKRQIKNALSWYYQKNVKRAISEIEKLINNLPDTTNVYSKISLDLYFTWLKESKQYNIAINKLIALKSLNHFDNNLRNVLIEFFELNEDWNGIVRELESVIKSNRRITEIDDFVFSISNAYENLKDYEKSRYYLNKLLLEYPSSIHVNQAKERIVYLNKFYLKNESMGVGQLALLIGDILNNEAKTGLQFKLGKIYFHNLIDYDNAINQFEIALSFPENNNIKSDILYYIGKSYFNLSQSKENTISQKVIYLTKAKEYYSKAIENINSSTNPDEVASELVESGILLDNPTNQKKINYYTTLLKKYPKSKLIEKWRFELAQIYFSNSNNDNALKEYEFLVNTFKSSPKYPDYLYSLTQLKQKSDEQILEQYRIIAGDFPNSKFAAAALYNMAEIYFNNAQFSEAGSLYNKLISEYFYTDFGSKAIQNIADTYISTDKYDKAITFYKNELENLPLNDEVLRNQVASNTKINALFKIGKAYYKIKDWANSRSYLSSYLKLSKDNIFKSEAYLLLGDTYYNFNDIQTAIDSYSKVEKTDNKNYRQALLKMGNCQFEIKKYSEASETFGAYIKVDQNEEIYFKYILAQLRAGKKSAANESIKNFKNKFPKKNNYLAAFEFERGEFSRINKNYNEALKSFKYVKSKYKKSDYVDNAAYHEALVYITLNKQTEALEILTNFAKTYKNSDKLGDVFNTLGGIYFRSEKYESAILSFKNALENKLESDSRRQVLSNLIKTYTYVSFWDAALALARDYINEYPDADDILDKKITISQAYVSLNQFDRAVDLLREARTEANAEKEPEIQFYIGEAYLRAGQYENAIAEFVKIPLLSQKTKLQWEASALYYSGQAYEKIGKIAEAIRMYEEIVKRPGIDLILKKDAQKRIEQIKS